MPSSPITVSQLIHESRSIKRTTLKSSSKMIKTLSRSLTRLRFPAFISILALRVFPVPVPRPATFKRPRWINSRRGIRDSGTEWPRRVHFRDRDVSSSRIVHRTERGSHLFAGSSIDPLTKIAAKSGRLHPRHRPILFPQADRFNLEWNRDATSFLPTDPWSKRTPWIGFSRNGLLLQISSSTSFTVVGNFSQTFRCFVSSRFAF